MLNRAVLATSNRTKREIEDMAPHRTAGGSESPLDLIVLGGGISGLSTAWFAHRRGIRVRVVEAASRVGGSIASVHESGYTVETGPNTVLQKPGRDEDALGRLVEQVGLNDTLRIADPLGKKRFVLRDGRIRPLPTSPPAFLTTDVFSLKAKLRLLREPFIARGRTEESIADFVVRRLGREFLDYAVEPFISGVYAGDPARLSVRAAVPRIHAIEQTYGSLIRGAVALGRIAKNAGQPAGRQVSFDNGLSALPAAISTSLPPGSVRLGTGAVSIEPATGGWTVRLADGTTETCRALVIALPAPDVAPLIAPHAPTAAALLRGIEHAAVVSAAFGVARNRVSHPLDGFGFLAPRREGLRTLGALFSSTLFADRAPDGHVLLTVFIGGTTDPEAVTLSDDALIDRLTDDLSRTLGITGGPDFVRLTRYRRAIPQYALGHLKRIAAIEADIGRLPGIYMRGNWLGGIAVADCIRNGETLAERLAADLGSVTFPRNAPSP